METLNENSGNQYLGMYYNRPPYQKLDIGDKVRVHPTPTSESKEPYEAEIIRGEMGVSTTIIGRHDCAMNDYLFNRLEFIRRA